MYITLEDGGARPPTDAEAAQIRKALGCSAVNPAFVTYTDTDSPVSLEDNGATVYLDATAGDITVSLPPLSATAGQQVTIKRMDASVNTVTIQPDAGDAAMIEGYATLPLDPGGMVTVGGNNAEWRVLVYSPSNPVTFIP